MVAPIWEGVTLIVDEVTKAANGQIMITAVMLHAIKLLRCGWLPQAAKPARLIMPGILLSGPAGADKSAVARRLLAESTELAAIADFQLVYRALTDVARNRGGRYPLRDDRLLPLDRVRSAGNHYRGRATGYRRHCDKQ